MIRNYRYQFHTTITSHEIQYVAVIFVARLALGTKYTNACPHRHGAAVRDDANERIAARSEYYITVCVCESTRRMTLHGMQFLFRHKQEDTTASRVLCAYMGKYLHIPHNARFSLCIRVCALCALSVIHECGMPTGMHI